MRTYLRIILDTIFPPTAHERLLRRVTKNDFLTQYEPLVIKDTIALAEYQSRTVQAAVAACKFEKNMHAAVLLSGLLEQWLSAHTVPGSTLLIPIPLSREREHERGFNQVTRVLESVKISPQYVLIKNWLERTTHTQRQTSLGRTERLKNLNGAFTTTSVLHNYDWSGVTRIIICDDVITTGATLDAARNTLQDQVPKHIRIICLAWAH